MSGHTKGEWVVNGAGGGFERIATLEPVGVIVASTHAPKPVEEIPNARLIAAAPDLLDELVEAHEIIRKLGEWVARRAEVSDPVMVVDIRYQERATAIAKAEGK